MIDHRTAPVVLGSERVPDAGTGSATNARGWLSAILSQRRAQAVLGLGALVAVALAVGIPARSLVFLGFFLLCPLMMLGMHGMHGGHADHAGAADADNGHGDRALAILRERYARGELDGDTYEAMRQDLELPVMPSDDPGKGAFPL